MCFCLPKDVGLFQSETDRALQIVSGVRSGRSAILESGHAATRVLGEIAEELGDAAILVRVPRDLDKSAYVPLVIARQCGGDLTLRVAESLTTDPAAALDKLSHAVSGKHLLVDGFDELYRPALDWDLRGAIEPLVRPIREWLARHTAVSTRSSAIRANALPLVRDQPRPDSRWASDLLWRRVEHDADRYVLAVARHLLLGLSDDPALGWDIESLLSDLWQGMPSDLRDLVGLLAVHHRPAFRDDIERLGLASRSVVESAIDGYLVEHQRDQIWLPAPWYSMYVNLAPLERRQERHRRWADAFASRARQEEGSPDMPLAVLEAHRHYALIPDLPRAREFARFGAGVLLGAAVMQSKAGRYDEAAKAYEMVLKLSDDAGAALNEKTRAYAIHYLHYNNHRKPAAESLEDTQRGYEEALALWPENALFWSRLIYSRFLANDEAGAMEALTSAWQKVPDHPERGAMLVVRTAERLLNQGLVMPALFVWGDHTSEAVYDVAEERRLARELAAGVTLRRLWAPGLPAVELPDAVHLRIEETQEPAGFRAQAGAITVRGATRGVASRAVVRGLIVEALADRWYRETGHRSLLSVRFKHPAWQQLLALGREIVPDLARRIERSGPSHLHHALAAITGESPLPPDAVTTVKEACAAWVAWAREHRYEW